MSGQCSELVTMRAATSLPDQASWFVTPAQTLKEQSSRPRPSFFFSGCPTLLGKVARTMGSEESDDRRRRWVFLKKSASSLADAASRKVEESRRLADEERERFVLQSAVEEESLPLVALLSFTDHEVRTWRGVDLSLASLGGELLYQGQAGYFDLDRFEKKRNEGFVRRPDGTEVARIVSRRGKEGSPTLYPLRIDGLPDQELRDVTRKMVSGHGAQLRYTFKSLEPMAGPSVWTRRSHCLQEGGTTFPEESGA